MCLDLEIKTAKKFLQLKQSAEARGKEFNLTLTGVKNLLRAKKCYYTGRALSDSNRSVDRIDNTKGYITGNVVACDSRINQLKDNLSKKELKQLWGRM